MTAIKSDRFGADRNSSDKSGSEKFGADRQSPESLSDVDQAMNAFEGEIREFVRRDTGATRRQRSDSEIPIALDPSTDNLSALIRRVSGASVEEIDRVIVELQGVRDMLRNEGDRVSREIAGYASLSHAAMTAMKVIGDSLAQWKTPPVNATWPGSPENPAHKPAG